MCLRGSRRVLEAVRGLVDSNMALAPNAWRGEELEAGPSVSIPLGAEK